jgi:hypothetical protein
MVLTYRYRIKDATSGRHLQQQAREVNRVWNYCGEVQNAARRHNKSWPSGFDLVNLTSGSSKLLGLHSDTVQAVCKRFAISRDGSGKRPPWRGRKSLGWIPFQAQRAIRLQGDTAIFLGRRYRLWLSRPIEGRILCGGFAEDARGRWYLNLQVELTEDRLGGKSRPHASTASTSGRSPSRSTLVVSPVYGPSTRRSPTVASISCTSCPRGSCARTGASASATSIPLDWPEPAWPSPCSMPAGRSFDRSSATKPSGTGPSTSRLTSDSPRRSVPRAVHAAAHKVERAS